LRGGRIHDAWEGRPPFAGKAIHAS
jgi:hypothetical protein